MEATIIRVGNRPRDKNDKSSGRPSPSKKLLDIVTQIKISLKIAVRGSMVVHRDL